MTAETDTLVKPDMKAVLERTHVSKDLHGFLLPMLEAVSNAMHRVERRLLSEAEVQRSPYRHLGTSEAGPKSVGQLLS